MSTIVVAVLVHLNDGRMPPVEACCTVIWSCIRPGFIAVAVGALGLRGYGVGGTFAAVRRNSHAIVHSRVAE
jgi:hypothetical protein